MRTRRRGEHRRACRGLCRPARRVHVASPCRGRSTTASTSSRARPRWPPDQGGDRVCRLVVDARQVLARGGPGVRGPAGRGRGRRRLRRGAAAPPDRRRRHGARARLRAPDARRPRRRRAWCSTIVLLVAWLVAALRATALLPRRLRRAADAEPRPRRDWDSDRMGLVALALVAVAFGLQSIIDWTWFIPGPAALALVAAGFVAGRGPRGRAARGRRSTAARPAPGRIAAAAGVGIAALVLAWAVWQPEASDRATGEALELADAGDVPAGDREDRGRAGPQPAQPGAAARAGVDPDPGGRRGRAPRTASSRRCSGSPAIPIPGTGWPRSSSALGPARRGARDAPGSALPRPVLDHGAHALPRSARASARARDGPGSAGPASQPEQLP